MITTGIIAVILGLIHILLLPIDALISTFLPTLNVAFNSIADYLTIIFSVMGWVISLSGIPTVALTLLIAYYTFKLSLPIVVWGIKVIINWYDALKP